MAERAMSLIPKHISFKKTLPPRPKSNNPMKKKFPVAKDEFLEKVDKVLEEWRNLSGENLTTKTTIQKESQSFNNEMLIKKA
jgi:hypothetical protein